MHLLRRRGLLGAAAAGLLVLGSCGKSGSSGGTGKLTISMSDPAICAAPNGGFGHVWITITAIKGNVSSSAAATDSGWITVLDLSKSPKQVDLLSLSSASCTINQLGTGSGVAPGNYQQLRLYLLANNATGTAVPSPNNCGSTIFNCVAFGSGTITTLDLATEAQDGIPIFSSEISSGGIPLSSGKAASININFNVCGSLVAESNGEYRLKPAIDAAVVPTSNNSISGSVVDSNTQSPISNAVVLVEQPDSSGVDRVMEAATTASDGSFDFCPLPSGNYDLIAADTSESPVTVPPIGVVQSYGSTVTFTTPAGSSLTIPLVAAPVNGVSSLPGTITGQISASNTSDQAGVVDVAVSALAQAAPPNGSAVQFTAPAFGGSTSTVATASSSACATATDCFTYTLYLPANTPSVGVFNSSGTAYSIPLPGSVPYTIDAQAFFPDGSGTPDCATTDETTSSTSGGAGLEGSPGGSATAQTLTFEACQ